MKIRVIVATRATQADFFSHTATGRSLKRMATRPIEVRIFSENTSGLPAVYNQAIRESINDPALLVFLHDDVHLLDYFIFERISNGLEKFEIIGVAGNKRRLPKQPSWAFIDTSFNWDSPEFLSGIVAHGKSFPPDDLSIFGEPRQPVKLLDGVLLASKSETLIRSNLYFDEIFDFHFYDVDFCRQAEERGLICATWDLAIMHESAGNFGSASWTLGFNRYLKKWGQ